MSLSDELERLADRAPVADVDPDTWRRARRAGRRDRTLVVAATVAVLAVLAGAVTWLPARVDPPVADTSGVGVPDHLYAVPERMTGKASDGSWTADEVTRDVTTVGVGAAAWATWGLPVVVDAARGGYHLLDLPDYLGNQWHAGLSQTSTLALSPDGTRLAYGYAVVGPDAATAPIPSGVRVVDLATGDVREIPVPGKEGTVIGHIAWSPDGRWLAFTGDQQDSWTAMTMRAGPHSSVVGRVPPAASQPTVRHVDDSNVPIAVDDRGTVQWRNGSVRTWGTGHPVHRAIGSLGRLPDGRWLERTGTAAEDVLSVSNSATGRRRILVHLIGVDGSVSVATDLMRPGHLTVRRPEPDWPWPDDRKVYTTAGAALALALLALALGPVWRRYRVAR